MKNLVTTLLAILSIPSLLMAQESVASPLESALKQYVTIQTALASDTLKGVPEAAEALATVAKSHAGMLPATLAAQAEAVGKATDLKAARAAFKPLSATIITAAAAKEKTGRYYEAFCPMAGAAWIQGEKTVANPYYGSSMLTCGEIRKEL